MARRLILTVILVVVVFLALCCTSYAQQETTPEPVGEEATEEMGGIYFYLDGELTAVPRAITGGSQMVEFALLELLKGPSEEEKASGYVTYIPEGVKLQYTTVKTDRSEFSVNLSRELMELSGDTDAASKALNQIVKTVQEVSGISEIGVTVAGEAMGDQPQDAFEALGVQKSETGGAETASQEGGGKGWLVLVIVFGALAVCLAAVAVIFFIRKREPSSRARAAITAAAKPEKRPAGKKAAKGKAGK